MRTNSKVVKNKLLNYIKAGVREWLRDNRDYFPECASMDPRAVVMYIFKREKPRNEDANYKIFKDWAQGLPSVLNCDYYYNISAVDLLGDILNESKKERARYNERQAEEMMTRLLYREVCNY